MFYDKYRKIYVGGGIEFMEIKIEYSSFAIKLSQILTEVFDKHYDFMYMHKGAEAFEERKITYEHNLVVDENYIPVVEMVHDIINMPNQYKQAQLTNPNELNTILSTNIKYILIFNDFLKPSGKNLIKNNINKIIACTYDADSDILSIEFE